MEKVLNQILSEIKELKQLNGKIEEINGKIEETNSEMKELKQNQVQTNHKIESLSDKMDAHGKSNREEFRRLNEKVDSISDALVKTMEDITEIKLKVDKQDVEIRVITGGK